MSKVNVSRHMPHCVGVRGINPNRTGKKHLAISVDIADETY